MRKTLPLIRKMQAALGAAFLSLLGVGCLSYYALDGTDDVRFRARQSHEILEHLQNLSWAIDNIETAYRGHASTGVDGFDQQAIANGTRADQEKAILKRLTVDSPAQQRRLASLAALTVPPMQGADATRAPVWQVNAIRAIQADMVRAERLLLTERRASVQRSLQLAKAGLVFGGLLGGIFVAAIGSMARRYYAQVVSAGPGNLESEERIRILVEGVQDYAIYMLDPQGKVTSWNAGAQRIKGYTADEIIGTNFSRFYSPEDVSRGIPHQELAMAAASGRIESERWRVRKDGSRFLANLVITAARDSAGTLIGFSEISRDISERKDTEAKYRGLLEAAPDAMIVVDQQGEIVLLNVQAEKQFGYPRDELLGQKVTAIIPEGFAERLIADETRSAADALAQQIGTGIELRARRKDGSAFPIEIMLSPLESKQGILVTAAIRNISVRKDAEAHLAQMEGRYRGLLEAAPDAMVVVDQGGKIVLLNVQAEKQFGYPRDELLGQKVTAIIPEGFAERLIADTTRSAADALAQQIGTGIELSALRKDGSEFPIEIMLSPLESKEGILVTAAIRDISVRKNAEAHLAEMEGRYRGLLEAAPEAIVISGPTGRILLVNAQMEKVFGYQREELIGQAVETLVPERFRNKHPDYRRGYHAHPRARSMGENLDLRGLRKDGSEFPVEITLSPLESPEGLLVTAVVRDITEPKKFQEHLLQTVGELKRSNAELEHFAYVASHDLQEPLRMVASYTQLLAKRYVGQLDTDADEFISYAVDGCTRMQRLINDLLAYSRAGANAKTPRKISSEVALHEALSNLQASIIESGAVVTHDALPIVTMDDTQLTQVFQNLIGNAVKYRSSAVPRVHVSAVASEENGWVFSVRDNGLGIDPQYFEKIFVLFQRLHGRDEFEGTGIGLAVCKKMLERIGGRIWLDSQLHHGSNFHFAVPEGVAT